MTSRTGNSMIDSMLDLQTKQAEPNKSNLDINKIETINDVSELAEIINKSYLDLSQEADKLLAKKFLERVAKKTQKTNLLESTDYDVINEANKKAFNKVSNSVRILSQYNDIKDKVQTNSVLELDMLNDYIGSKKLLVTQTIETKATLQSNVESSIQVKQEAKSEIKELHLEKDEEKAIIKYLGLKESDVDDINLSSAIAVISGPTAIVGSSKESWEKAGYKADGFFGPSELKQLNALVTPSNLLNIVKIRELQNDGISIKDIINTRDLLANSKAENILNVLFDTNSDGKVDKNDNGINNSKAILDYANKMIKDGKSTQLFSSISNIIGVNVSNKEDLYKKLVERPELKYKFIKEINILTGAGDAGATFVTDVLEHGKDATRVSMEKKKEANTYINSVLETKKSSVNKLYDEALEKFKNGLNVEDKKKYEALISSLSSVEAKKSIFENFRLNGAGILVNLVDGHKGVGGATSFTNESVNDFLIKNTESIIKGLNFEVGVANFGGNLVPGVGMSIDIEKNLTSETRAFGKIGIINIIPYALVGLETQINADTIKKSGFADLSDTTKYAGATVNVSTFAWGLGVHYREDQLKSIETQEKSFNEFMTKFISDDGVINEDLVKSQSDYAKNKDYYEKLISNLKETLRIQNFAHLSPEFKKEVIMSIRNSYTFTWRENMLKEAQKEGYKFSGIGFGVEFIAGFLPIPVIGASVSKVGMTYDENKLSKVYAIIAEAKHVVIKTQTTQNDGEVLNNVAEINTGMDFLGHKALFRNFAQNHPKTWEHLVTSKGLSSDEEASLILTMFKSDKSKNTKFFKEFISKLETYKKSTDLDDKRKMNELIAGFYDISFADIRSTSEVIMGYTKNGNKYEGTFNFQESRKKAMEKFAVSEGLSTEFVNQNQMIVSEIKSHHAQELKAFKAGKLKNAPEIAQIKDPTLFALVASYKIDAKGHSLGKGFVDIPAGQANIADGVTKEIKNSQDIKHLVDAFTKTASGKNTMTQLVNTINTKEENFISSSDDFVQLLEKGVITKNGKSVSLNREFVYFLYGQCANESMGLRIKGLKFEGFNTSREVEEVTYGNIAPDGVLAVQTNTTNIPRGVLTNLAIGIVGTNGDERKESSSNGGGGGGNGGGGGSGTGGNTSGTQTSNTNLNSSGGSNIG